MEWGEVFPYLPNYSVLCRQRIITNIVHNIIMKQYLGVIVMLIGAFLQVFSYLSDQVESANIFLATGLCLVIAGYLVHIFLNKKIEA